MLNSCTPVPETPEGRELQKKTKGEEKKSFNILGPEQNLKTIKSGVSKLEIVCEFGISKSAYSRLIDREHALLLKICRNCSCY